MRLGAAYNVFDGEELLEKSIAALHGCVDFVCVVYQTRSNFGCPCNEGLVPLLERLKAEGRIDVLVEYEPQTFTREQRRALTSPYASLSTIGDSIANIGEQFLNELTKREIGRKLCEEHGCTYFMSCDCDEFYRAAELERVKRYMEDHPIYDGCACLMRYFYKSPTYELLPPDDRNHVPIMYKIRPGTQHQLAHPYPCLIDPTRSLAGVQRFKIFDAGFIQMYHYSFVRTLPGILSKLRNVSNKGNYTMEEEAFLKKFQAWHPGTKKRAPHPHPYFAAIFTKSEVVENWFDLPELVAP